MRSLGQIPASIRLVLRSKVYMTAFAALSLLLFAAYSYLLSSSSINLAVPRIVFGLNIYTLTVSILISVLLSLSVVMDVFALANRAESGAKLSIGATIAGLIPASLCCTSFIPAALAVLGASTSTIIGTVGALQGPFATFETLFIAASVALLLLSISLTSRSISSCCKVVK